MGVVEQQREGRAAGPQPSDGGNQGGVVPLMDDDEVGARAERRGIIADLVDRRPEVGIGAREGFEPGLPGVRQEVVQAPGALRLERLDGVAAGAELAQDAAQEVGVAVVPAGAQRVGEVGDLHAALLARGDPRSAS